MSLLLLWSLIGIGFLIVLAVLISRIDATGLGANGSRLLAVGVATLAYYGSISLWKFSTHLANPVRYPWLRYAVPIAAILAGLYYAWQLHRNWRVELQGLLRAGLQLLLIVICAFLARLFLSL